MGDATTIHWCNWLRAIATIAVICIHVTGDIVITNSLNTNWYIANLFNSISRFSVPVFLMLTGCFLLSKDKDTDLKLFLKKRFLRILIPFLFWSLFYYGYRIYNAGSFSDIDTLIHITKESIIYGTSFHLWYIYVLLGVYLAIPIINKWIKYATNKDIIYFLSLWFIGICTVLFDLGQISSIFKPFVGLFGYVILGYYLFNKNFSSTKRVSLISILLFFFSGLAICLLTVFFNKNGGQFNNLVYDYQTPLVIMASVSVFLMAKYSKICSTSNKAINFISRYSYGIYLNHILILIGLRHFNFTYNFTYPIIGIPMLTIICLVLSMAVLFVMSRIPILKGFTGISSK